MTWVAQTQVGLKPVSMDGFRLRISHVRTRNNLRDLEQINRLI